MWPDRSLPIRFEPMEDESGSGYCLRLASRNGLSTVELRKLVGMSEVQSFRQQHITRLAMLSGLDPARLTNRLPASLRGIRSGVSYMGHPLRSGALYRGRRPQVCLMCIACRKYCRFEWDFTLSCVCQEHLVALTDRCPSCMTALRWDRPSVDWARCGHCLAKFADSVPPLPAGLVEMQSVMRSILTQSWPPSLSFVWPFPERVSLDGWFSLVLAFGTITQPYRQPLTGTFSSIPSSAEVQSIILRAHERLRAFSCRFGAAGDELKAWIAEAPLLGLLREGLSEKDRAVAMEVYRFVEGEQALEAFLRRLRLGSQLKLFE